MSDGEIRQLISKLKWTFAKTYADKSPHEYAIVKPGNQYRDEMLKFVCHIFKHGEVEMYYTTPFVVLKIDGRKYWTVAGEDEDLSDENYILNRSLEGQADVTYGDKEIQ